jgi:hypothetical protein
VPLESERARLRNTMHSFTVRHSVMLGARE